MNSDTVRLKSGLSHVETDWMWPKYLQMRLLSKQTDLIFSDSAGVADFRWLQPSDSIYYTYSDKVFYNKGEIV